MASTFAHHSEAHQTEKDQQANEKLNKILAHVAEMRQKRDRAEAAERLKQQTDKYGPDGYLPLIDEPLRNGGGSPRHYKSALVDKQTDRKLGESSGGGGGGLSTAELLSALALTSGAGGGGGATSPRITSSSSYGIAYAAATAGSARGGLQPSPPSPRNGGARQPKPVEPTSLAIGENEDERIGAFVKPVPSPPAGRGYGGSDVMYRNSTATTTASTTAEGATSALVGRFAHSPRIQKHLREQRLIEDGAAEPDYQRYRLIGPPQPPQAPAMVRSATVGGSQQQQNTKEQQRHGTGGYNDSNNKRGSGRTPRRSNSHHNNTNGSSNFKMGSPRNGFISKTTFSTAFDHCYQATAAEMAQGGPTPSPRQLLKARALDGRLPAPRSMISGWEGGNDGFSSPSSPMGTFGGTANSRNNQHDGETTSDGPAAYKTLIRSANSEKAAQEAALEALRAHVVGQLRQYRTDEEVERRGTTQRGDEFAQGVKASLPLESDNIVRRKRGIRVYENDAYEVSPVSDLQHQKARSPKEGLVSRRRHIANQDNLTLKLTKKRNQIEDTSIFAAKNGHLRAGLASIETKGNSPRGVHQ